MPRKGYRQTEEHRKKHSLSKMGHSFSDETLEKIRIGNLGKKRSQELCEKMSKIKKLQGIRPPSRLGCKPWNYQGLTPLHMLIRNSVKFMDWRAHIFKRDKFTCQNCGQVGKKLNAHHIKSFHKIFREFLQKYINISPKKDKELLLKYAMKFKYFWDTKNGITLCEFCHKKYFSKWR